MSIADLVHYPINRAVVLLHCQLNMLLQDTICVPRLNIPHIPGVLGIASHLYLSDGATPQDLAHACMSTADAGKL
jgi:hypothetical protein